MAKRNPDGAPVIDPTKNVLDALAAANRRQDDLREMESRYATEMRDAETRRINDLATCRAEYEIRMEAMRAKSVETTSNLLALQLREVKTDLSDRTAKLEQFRWETGGKSLGQAAFLSYLVAAAVIGGAVAGILFKVMGAE